jgi:hypothetical protein
MLDGEDSPMEAVVVVSLTSVEEAGAMGMQGEALSMLITLGVMAGVTVVALLTVVEAVVLLIAGNGNYIQFSR